MKKILILSISILISLPLISQQIDWIEDFDLALERAQDQEQNVLVLLTAPDWSAYDQWMEENTLNQREVIEWIDQGFIACRITDTNPQVDNFQFSGFPTIQIFSPQGEMLSQAEGAVDPSAFMAQFQSFQRSKDIHPPNPILLYGRTNSQRTQKLIEYYEDYRIDYEFHDVSIPEERQEIKEAIEAYGYTGTIYLPIIIIDGQIYFPPS